MTEENISAEQPTLGVWQRIKGAVFSPVATFQDVAAHPRFAGGALAICGINLALTLLIAPKIKDFTRYSLSNNPNIASDQAAAVQNIAATSAVVSAAVMSVIGPFVLWLVYATILKVINFFSGERTPFSTLYAIATFAYVPALLGGLVGAFLILSAPVENFTSVTVSLAAILPTPENLQSPGPLYLFLSKINPFTIWSLALLSLGGALAMKTGTRVVATGVFGTWLVYITGYVVLISAFSPLA
ncbi:MAG: YIP1 family protein [Peptococcaceae bacterium]|nr:YIP1 family protein [Peptococcaceae bacterium]